MPLLSRPATLATCFGALALAIAGQAVRVQVWQHARWARAASREHTATSALPPQRGVILDARGARLAETRTLYRFAVAPREIRQRDTLQALLTALACPDRVRDQALDTAQRWVVIPGRFAPGPETARLLTMTGVYGTEVPDRVIAPGEGLRRLLGHVDADGRGADGLERRLDSLLRGTPGTELVLRDGRGRRMPGPGRAQQPPIPGASVRLTISRELQDIAENALQQAITSTGAIGGDVVMLEPATGAIRALVSLRPAGPEAGLPAVGEPYEPGSTLKPFYAAALLASGKATPDDVVPTYNGRWDFNGRTLIDEHVAPSMSLRTVIAQSSNIGAVQFTLRMTAAEQYGALAALHFGQRTGLPVAGESPGQLRPVAKWSNASRVSLAIGYELLVTPVQLAAAYGTLANGGIYIAPTLVEHIESSDGTPLPLSAVGGASPAVARVRIYPEAAAREVVAMLKGVVDLGTATRAGLTSYAIAGKTGTANRVVDGVYGSEVTASFVGMFPADAPQWVVLIKLDSPRGQHYGGLVAAPVMKAIISEALASASISLDRVALAAARRERTRGPATGVPGNPFAAPAVEHPSPEHGSTIPATRGASTEASPLPQARLTGDPAPDSVTVPDVTGLSTRVAIARLASVGLGARLTAPGAHVRQQAPGAGVRIVRPAVVALAP